MNDLEKAARLALERLRRADKISGHPNNRAVIAALESALAQQAKPVHGLVSDAEYLRLFQDARAGSDRWSGLLRGIQAVIAAYEAAAPVAEPVAVQAEPVVDRAQERSADDKAPSRAVQAEPVVEAHRVLAVEALPAALITANWCETEDVGDEDIAAKLRRLHRLEQVVEAIESGESFEVLEKLAADFRKGVK
jgi:hypothetical protein